MKAEFFLQQIKAEFPQLQWKSYRRLTHGWDHHIFILDEKIVFRFPKDERYTAAFQNEIRLLGYLKKHIKAGIPAYNYIGKNRTFGGYTMVMGRELELPQFQALSASEKEIITKQLAEFITTLHATPESVINKCKIETENQVHLYQALVEYTKNFLFPRLGKKDIQLIDEYFVELETALSQHYSNVLVHNDLTGEHILWESSKQQVNIIDFSDCMAGDPAIDFSGLMAYGTKFTEDVFELYAGKKDDQMLYRAHLYFKRIPLWLMNNSMQGFPITFEQGYELFQKRFEA